MERLHPDNIGRRAAMILRYAMERVGFSTYEHEWWHYEVSPEKGLGKLYDVMF